MQKRVLIVDADIESSAVLQPSLEKAGLAVYQATDGSSGMAMAREQPPDIALLALTMPDMEGSVLCRTLRANRGTASIPIFIIGAGDDPGERERCFASGADDFVRTPFDTEEIVFRVQAFLKWSRTAAGGRNVLEVDEFVVDSDALDVYLDGNRLYLTITELRLLVFLLSDPGHFKPRHELVRNIWGHKNLQDSRAVDTCMRRIREKVGVYASRFETQRGVGYRYIAVSAGSKLATGSRTHSKMAGTHSDAELDR